MNYQEFLSEVRVQLAARVEPDAVLQVKPMPRNNGTSYDGLVIMNPGRNISPTIYLTPYYHRYLDGVELEEIYADILCTYRKNLPENDFDTSRFTDFENVRPNLVMRLVNYERNEEMLKGVPYYRFQDLAVTFYCLLYADEMNQASILVHNEHLEMWAVTADELYTAAMENSVRLLPPCVTPIREILEQLNAVGLSDLCENEVPILVASNQYRTNGASVILYEGLLAEVAARLDADLLILPSSVHEVLLLPVSDDSELEAAGHMVREVNETQLADEEVLADHAYYYDRADQLIRYR